MARRRAQVQQLLPGVELIKATRAKASQPGGSVGLSVKAQYDAASQGRRMSGWNAPSTGPNRAVAGLQAIRNRSRDSARNEWASSANSRVMVTSLVGTGIVARPKTKNATLKAKLTAEWDAFCESIDADGVNDFYGQQALAVQSWVQAGEVFARLRSRRLSDGLPVPLQVQLLESDMVPLLDVDQWPGMPSGAKIRQGVEFDKLGRRSAYWMHKEHPGDAMTGFGSVSLTELVRVPADQVMHIFKPLRPGQIRGVPDSAPILAKLRAVMNFDDAVLTRQQIANLFTLFITRPMPTGGDATIDPLTGKTITQDANGAPMASLEPGISQELLPGEDVKFSSPPDSGANYSEFMRQNMLGISAGQGTPYELMTGDIKDVSDRTLRVIINEFRRYCEQLQWLVIIPRFCKPVRQAWALSAVVAGKLTMAEAEEARRTDWQPQGWQYIHPVQDVQAKALEVEKGFRSRASVIAERGYDPEAVDAERAEDKARAEGLGLAFPPVDPNAPPPVSPQEEAEAERTNAEARLFDAKAARERSEGDAALIRARADASRLKAEADLAVARSNQAGAEASAAEARADLHAAEAEAEKAMTEMRTATEREESAERVRATREAAEQANAEAEARRAALRAAEDHADAMRVLSRQAEANKVEVSRLEVEAARVGLDELRAA